MDFLSSADFALRLPPGGLEMLADYAAERFDFHLLPHEFAKPGDSVNLRNACDCWNDMIR